MGSGIWTAVSGATAQANNLDVIANNLANTDTPAFKKNLPAFQEYLAAADHQGEPQDIPRGPFKDKDFYPLDGRDQSFVKTRETQTNFQQGSLKVTHRPLDVALEGPGFLEVSTPNGIRYTRQGNLKVAADGRLVTQDGYAVLASEPQGLAGRSAEQAAAAIPSRFINLRDRGNRLSLNEKGELYANEELVSRLSMVEFKDIRSLKKQGGNLFEDKGMDNAVAPTGTRLHQGMIETSNVNPIEEMTNMIKANRLFEQDLKAIKTYGELQAKEANEIGKL